MTKSEAIKVLEKYKRYAEGILTDEVLDSIAFDMAIESLSADEEKENGTFVNRDNWNFNCNDSNRTLVDVVRCKDCKHAEHREQMPNQIYCHRDKLSLHSYLHDDDDFCKYGERREE